MNNTFVPFNDLSRGLDRDSKDISEAISTVINSGHLVLGKNCSTLEVALSDLVGVSFCLGVASGTDALELAFKSAMPAGKTRVITAANAGGYSSIAAFRSGFSVTWADIEMATQSISLESVKENLSDDVGIVVVTHLFGLTTDISELVSYCHSKEIKVVEDCAQSLGGITNGKSSGSQGDVATTSFYPTKNLGAIGDGGAIFTSDVEIFNRIKSLRQYGWQNKYHISISGGINSRLDEIQAAVLNVRLPLLNELNARRREIITRYFLASQNSPITVLPAEDENHVGHLAVALSEQRDAHRSQLADFGIATDIHFPIPDHKQKGFYSSKNRFHSLTNTENAAARIFSLPCFPEMTDSEVQQVVDAISELK